MQPALLLNKALLLLDRGLMEKGEQCLRNAIIASETDNDDLILARSLCCLGDLLVLQGRAKEARPYLERVIEFSRPDDVLDYEIKRAHELLEGING
jgi:hypothetical protein